MSEPFDPQPILSRNNGEKGRILPGSCAEQIEVYTLERQAHRSSQFHSCIRIRPIRRVMCKVARKPILIFHIIQHFIFLHSEYQASPHIEVSTADSAALSVFHCSHITKTRQLPAIFSVRKCATLKYGTNMLTRIDFQCAWIVTQSKLLRC